MGARSRRSQPPSTSCMNVRLVLICIWWIGSMRVFWMTCATSERAMGGGGEERISEPQCTTTVYASTFLHTRTQTHTCKHAAAAPTPPPTLRKAHLRDGVDGLDRPVRRGHEHDELLGLQDLLQLTLQRDLGLGVKKTDEKEERSEGRAEARPGFEAKPG
jgi:hypothetical protein